MKNLLNEFLNHRSDASNLECSDQEELQKRFQEWIETRKPTFEESVEPLMKFLAENHHPHTTCIVVCNRAELVEGIETYLNDEFIVD